MTTMTTHSPTLILFNYDWDAVGFARASKAGGSPVPDHAGFDLFSFPSNAHLAWFDIERFVARLARQARAKGWTAVVSHHEQFGALAAAMLAEKMGWPGTPVKAVLACQHKVYARQVLARVCPQASVGFSVLDAEYGADVPHGLRYPLFVKPVKAAFSVLARMVHSHQELTAHTRFGAWELWVIRHLVEPFERVFQKRMGPADSAHRLMVEEPVNAPQFNLDGYVWKGKAELCGVVDAIMYPGTQAFMRWDFPSKLGTDIQRRAMDIAQTFLSAVGFDHGLFNMEFFYDEAQDRVTVIEFNPRMASQFSDLYLRVCGVDLHACSLAMAQGQHPDTVKRAQPSAGAASSLVYRSFDRNQACAMPNAAQAAQFEREYPDGLLFPFPKDKGSIERDFKWLGCYRYGIVHLGGKDEADLRRRAESASALLGWVSPYQELQEHTTAAHDGTKDHRPAQIQSLIPYFETSRS
jgi:D-alanine-D-alanine ligase-like ATP-grasp enzyme